MEYVDIVSEAGDVIKTVSKDQSHKEGLLHVCVIGLLINSEGQIMLIKPPAHKQDAHQYVCPVGGHVTSGESEIDALKREVAEEIGVTQFSHKRIGKATFDRHVLGRHENHVFVLFEIYSDQEPVGGSELESMHWFSREKLAQKIKKYPETFGDAFFFVFERFYRELL